MSPQTLLRFTMATQPVVAFRSVETNPLLLPARWPAARSVTVAARDFHGTPLTRIFAPFVRCQFVSALQSLDGHTQV